jgi:hypothetical protein
LEAFSGVQFLFSQLEGALWYVAYYWATEIFAQNFSDLIFEIFFRAFAPDWAGTGRRGWWS